MRLFFIFIFVIFNKIAAFAEFPLRRFLFSPWCVRCSVMFRWHKRDSFSGCLLRTSLTLNKVCIPHSVELQTSRWQIFTGWYLLDPWRIAGSMLLCYCWGSGEDFISGLGCCQTLLRVRQTLIKLSGCFVGTSSTLAVLRLTAQHLSHCAWLFGIHGAWHSFSCCWGLCGIGTDWLVGIGIVHYETKWGDGKKKKHN